MGQRTAGQAMTRKKEIKWLALAALIPIVTYLWGLWCYGGLYRSGQLLSASKVTPDTILSTLAQNTVVLLPQLLTGTAALVLLGRERFTEEMGLRVRRQKKTALLLAAGACLLTLAVAFLLVKAEPLAIGYQWVYYLLFVALTEEFTFRSLLPFLAEKSGAPAWVVWIFPGMMFSCMHTLIPMTYNGFTVKAFIWSALTMLGGYTAGHCGYYALRRWSGTLWLPVLVHGTLDFLSIFM